MQTKLPSHTSTESPQIVDRRENVPQKLSGKNAHRVSRAPKIWADADHWDQLATVYLPRYDLPAWDAPCSPEAMETWLDRLDLSERDYLYMSGLKRLKEFIRLNPTWPLLAWLGTVLELDRERRGG